MYAKHNKYQIFSQLLIAYHHTMKIYHNPRCSTSRKALQIIKDKGIEPELILYMTEPIKPKKLASVLKKLKMSPLDLIRKKEVLFKDEFKDLKLTDEEWIQVMIDHPKLMERPIVEDGRKAVVGRPLERIDDFLKTN